MNIIYRRIAYSLFIGMSFVSCEKDSLVTDVPLNQDVDPNFGKGVAEEILSPFYVTAKIDTVKYTFQDGLSGFHNSIDAQVFLDCGFANVLYGQSTRMGEGGSGIELEIKILKCILDVNNKDEQKSLIFLGPYPFGSSNPTNQLEGVEVKWIDKDGLIWKTEIGHPESIDDTFIVEYILDNPSSSSIGDKYIIGNMSLHVYNGSENIYIENANFSLQYGLY